MGWIDKVKSAPLTEIAKELGLRPSRLSSLGPCPDCGAEKRGKGDGRGPIGYKKTPDGDVWACQRSSCDAKGDGIDLVALVLRNARMKELDEDGTAEVRQWFSDRGWCDARGQHPTVKTISTSSVARKRSGGGLGKRKMSSKPNPNAGGSGGGGARRDPRFAWSEELAERYIKDLWTEDGAPVLEYLTEGRRLSKDTLAAWAAGALLVRDGDGKVVERWVMLPMLDADARLVNMRFRSVPGPCLRCGGEGCDACSGSGVVEKTFRVCQGRPLPLFGAQNLPADRTQRVVVVEGELDVLAMWEYGVHGVVSGTAGAGAAWKDDWLDAIEPYQDIIICLDDDEAGASGTEKLIEALGAYRCSKARLPENDVGDCLQAGVAVEVIERALDMAETSTGVVTRRANEFADELERLILHPELLCGLKTGSHNLDRAIGGLFPGLWVVTGDTNDGKTSFCTWLLWMAANHEVPGCLTSFEDRPIRAIQRLLRLEIGGNFLNADEAQRRAGLESLGKKPLEIVDRKGIMPGAELLDHIRFMKRRHGTRLYFVDHLHYLVPPEVDDERRYIEELVRSMAINATDDGMTVFLVVHPDKTYVRQRRRVTLGDAKGASAIQQEAHAGLVIEKTTRGKSPKLPGATVHVEKLRSEFGVPGSKVNMYYDPWACLYADTWEETPAAHRNAVPAVS